MCTATTAALLATAMTAAPNAVPGLKSFGTAIKQARLEAGVEKTVFEYSLSPGATHGVMTQAWHAGKPSGVNPNLRIRYYIDNETEASVDYPLFLAHAVGPAQTSGTNIRQGDVPGSTPTSATGPWGNMLFGRTHDSGWYNNYQVPFQKSIKITITDDASSSFWYMCRGVENLPIVVAGITLPTTTRLKLTRTDKTVQAGDLVTLANITGSAGILRQTNMVINSSNYHYQEGCVSAWIDGDTPIWLSSGLEDYFLGAYFHSMPTERLPFSGFQVMQPATAVDGNISTNSLAAYRIHEPDPLLFTKSFSFQWIASSDNGHKNGGYCNYDWPAAPLPHGPPAQTPDAGTISLDVLTWVYVWDEQ